MQLTQNVPRDRVLDALISFYESLETLNLNQDDKNKITRIYSVQRDESSSTRNSALARRMNNGKLNPSSYSEKSFMTNQSKFYYDANQKVPINKEPDITTEPALADDNGKNSLSEEKNLNKIESFGPIGGFGQGGRSFIPSTKSQRESSGFSSSFTLSKPESNLIRPPTSYFNSAESVIPNSSISKSSIFTSKYILPDSPLSINSPNAPLFDIYKPKAASSQINSKKGENSIEDNIKPEDNKFTIGTQEKSIKPSSNSQKTLFILGGKNKSTSALFENFDQSSTSLHHFANITKSELLQATIESYQSKPSNLGNLFTSNLKPSEGLHGKSLQVTNEIKANFFVNLNKSNETKTLGFLGSNDCQESENLLKLFGEKNKQRFLESGSNLKLSNSFPIAENKTEAFKNDAKPYGLELNSDNFPNSSLFNSNK